MQMPDIPIGTGAHPVMMLVLSSDSLEASRAFYAQLFGWQTQALTKEIVACMTPSGPTVTLRAQLGAGAQRMVPFVSVADVPKAIAEAATQGAVVERAPWTMPMMGTLARVADASGFIWGLTSAMAPAPPPRIPMPMGPAARPPVGSVCHVEFYAPDGAAAGAFVQQQFGWGSVETMPAYRAFDAGAGVGGIFQSHTPALVAVAYLASANVDETLAAVTQAGGVALGAPMRVPGMATFGYFTDPSGTTMGLLGPA
jgi:hypothetical protein